MTNHFSENEPKADSLTKTHPWCSLSLSTLQASLRNPQQRPFCIVDHRSKETRKIKNPWCHLLFTLENAGNQGKSWFKMCLWTPSQMIFNYRIYRPLKYEKISSIDKKDQHLHVSTGQLSVATCHRGTRNSIQRCSECKNQRMASGECFIDDSRSGALGLLNCGQKNPRTHGTWMKYGWNKLIFV